MKNRHLFTMCAGGYRTSVLGASTFTWSPDVRALLRRLGTSGVELDEVWVDGAAPYGLTATLRPGVPTPLPREWITSLATDLRAFAYRYPLVLFRDMIGGDVTYHAVRVLLTALRDEMVRSFGDPRSALVPAISTASAGTSEFPLHCDLFGAERLLNIFNAVPSDGSGSALLLPLDAACDVLAESGAPSQVIGLVRRLVQRRAGFADSFHDLMQALYSAEHDWSAEFTARAVLRAVILPSERGTGYLLDDSRFLHGRASGSQAVSQERLVRLVFAARPLAAGGESSGSGATTWQKARTQRDPLLLTP